MAGIAVFQLQELAKTEGFRDKANHRGSDDIVRKPNLGPDLDPDGLVSAPKGQQDALRGRLDR